MELGRPDLWSSNAGRAKHLCDRAPQDHQDQGLPRPHDRAHHGLQAVPVGQQEVATPGWLAPDRRNHSRRQIKERRKANRTRRLKPASPTFDNNSSSGYTSPIQDKTLSRSHLTAGRGHLDHARLHQIPANAQRRHSFRPGADRTSIASTLQKDFQFPFRAMCGKVRCERIVSCWSDDISIRDTRPEDIY